MDRVGVIGLGKMGLPIARNLMVRGFRVTGYRRSGSPELVKEGGEAAASAAEVAAEADLIVSIVPTADDVEEIITGPSATVTALKPGTVHLALVQQTLDSSIASSAIWKQRGPVMAVRAWSPAPGPVRTLHPILEQIEDHAAATGLSAPVFAAAKEVFDKAMADGWADLDIACVHDQVSGVSALDDTGLEEPA